MKEYQIISDKSLVLPEPVYHQVLWIVRDMDRLISVSESESRAPDAIIARFRVSCYNEALCAIPEEYREGISKNIKQRGGGFSDFASPNTWRRWKQLFIYTLARKLDLY